jgi:hypothetical protein
MIELFDIDRLLAAAVDGFIQMTGEPGQCTEVVRSAGRRRPATGRNRPTAVA